LPIVGVFNSLTTGLVVKPNYKWENYTRILNEHPIERALREQTDFLNLLNQYGSFFDSTKIEIEWKNLHVYFDKSVADKYKTLSLDLMWRDLQNVKSLDESETFPNLCKLANLVLIVLHSNAEAERIFSIVSDVKI
jgi:hypothetical protein